MTERFIRLCNNAEFPLREFIERTLGPGHAYRNPWCDRGMRWPPPTPAEDALDREQYGPPQYEAGHNGESRHLFFDLSGVIRSADKPAFYAYEQPGPAVGHSAGLARVDFG